MASQLTLMEVDDNTWVITLSGATAGAGDMREHNVYTQQHTAAVLTCFQCHDSYRVTVVARARDGVASH